MEGPRHGSSVFLSNIYLLIIILTCHIVATHAGIIGEDMDTAGCQFDASWYGVWKGGSTGRTEIGTFNFNNLTCSKWDRQTDRFVVTLKTAKGTCSRCLSIKQKNFNVLKYRISNDCSERSQPASGLSFDDVCGEIELEERVYFLIRMNPEPRDCPFGDGKYRINDLVHDQEEICLLPESTTGICATGSQVIFDYRPCDKHHASFYSKAEQITCLGSWAEGNNSFFFGKIDEITNPAIEAKYRCYMYKSTSEGFHVSVSAFATCTGLEHEGAEETSLSLYKRQKVRHCLFPSWFHGAGSWYSKDYGLLIEETTDGDILVKQINGTEVSLTSRYTCVEALSSDFFLVSGKFGCIATPGCLQFVLESPTTGVITIDHQTLNYTNVGFWTKCKKGVGGVRIPVENASQQPGHEDDASEEEGSAEGGLVQIHDGDLPGHDDDASEEEGSAEGGLVQINDGEKDKSSGHGGNWLLISIIISIVALVVVVIVVLVLRRKAIGRRVEEPVVEYHT